ncbi:MAG TPA: hypothetical protein PLP19_13795 [bacterium]|nr:hypothetical protein [bacterium]HPN44560.1 hypothetical protein [bacterium]
MNRCKTYKKNIILAHYKELDEIELAQLQAHLEICQACRQEAAAMQQFGALLQENQPEQVTETALEAMRHVMQLKLGRRKKVRTSSFTVLSFKPAMQFALVLLLFAFGFLVGRQGQVIKPSAPGIDPLQQLLTASGSVRIENGAMNPYLMGVDRLKYNPDNGTIEIQYNMINEVQLAGNLDNPAIKELLVYAMLSEENTNIRRHAVKAMQAAAQGRPALDMDYLQPLEKILQSDENPGLKLMALDALKAMPLNDQVKSLLVRVLLYDSNTSVRIDAFKTLTSKQMDEKDLQSFLHEAVNDSSKYISFKSEQLLEMLQEQKSNKGPYELSRKE